MSKRLLSQLIFCLMSAHSFLSAFVFPSDLRTVTFLGAADLYFALLLLVNSIPRMASDSTRRPSGNAPLLLSAVILVGIGAAAFIRFGPLYLAVELRPYVEALLLFMLINVLGRQIDLSWLPTLFLPFCVAEIVFIAANYAVATHKIGIFGEMNYDVQLVVIMLALAARSISLIHIAYAIVAKTKTFAAYTTLMWILRRRLTRFLAFIALVAALPILVGMSFEMLDRFDRLVILRSLIDIIFDRYNWILLCGQLFCGDLFYEPILGWYISTQALSSSLDSVVPAVFHGHLLRNIFLLGVPLTLLGYGLLCFRLLLRRGAAGLLVGWIAVTAISQSIFHHPFVGLALIFTIAYYLQRDRHDSAV